MCACTCDKLNQILNVNVLIELIVYTAKLCGWFLQKDMVDGRFSRLL